MVLALVRCRTAGWGGPAPLVGGVRYVCFSARAVGRAAIEKVLRERTRACMVLPDCVGAWWLYIISHPPLICERVFVPVNGLAWRGLRGEERLAGRWRAPHWALFIDARSISACVSL